MTPDSHPRPSPFGNAEALRARQAEWDRFHTWETEHPLGFPDLRAAWRWYEEMYQLARKTGAIPDEPRLDMEKICRVQTIQARLAHIPWPR